MPEALSGIDKEVKTFATDKAIERQDITPKWFRRQRIALRIGEAVNYQLRQMDRLLREYSEIVRGATSGDKSYTTAIVALRGVEISKRVYALEKELQNLEEFLTSYRKIKDIPYHAINVEQLVGARTDLYDSCLEKLATTVHRLDFRGWQSGNLPDLFGQTYYLLADECYNYARFNEKEKFRRLFRAFFFMGAYATDSFRRDIDGRNAQDRNVVGMRDTFLDLMAVSGVAAAFDEVTGGDTWSEVRACWDNFLDEVYGTDAGYNLVNVALRLDHGVFGAMSPRSLGRTKLGQRLLHDLREDGVIKSNARRQSLPCDIDLASDVPTASAYLYALLGTSAMHPKPEVGFAGKLILERSEIDPENFFHEVSEFVRMIKRYRECDEGR